MKGIWRLLAAIGIALAVWIGSGTGVALADDDDTPSSWRISRYHTLVTLRPDATADVTLTLTFDFDRDPGHGPFITIPTRQRTADPDQWLNLGVKIKSVTSPTGANTATEEGWGPDGVLLRIGTRGIRFTGEQRYVINYELSGLVASKQKVSGLDEFNWNFVGPLWKVPISQSSATVRGPAKIERVACFTGTSYSQPCKAETNGTEATFVAGALQKEVPAQIVAGFPPGTFPEQSQTFSKRYYLGNMFPLTPVTGTATVAATLGAWVLVRSRVRRFARDEEYLGLTPGLMPAAGQEANVGARRTGVPIAVQFSPPKGATPGEIGTLIDATADHVDITATIIDLAVRGKIGIIPGQRREDFTLQLIDPNMRDLLAYESELLDMLFAKGPVVTSEQLEEEDYADVLVQTRRGLYRRVVELGWFKGSPDLTWVKIIGIGLASILAGFLVSFLGSFVGWGLLGIAGIVAGILLIASAKRYTARTADGSAVLAQAKGFELYLATAEAEQIKFEEGIDVFSKYLPYAIIFGVADRWVKVFKQLEQAGLYTPNTTWYGGTHFYMFDAAGFSAGMGNLTEAMSSSMSSAMSAASSGSSGDSGFSGGGGFGGGGGGGW